ncbi:MAG TPA: glycosyltransferase family 4 protein [Thermoanaerobaculia bacterium]
MKVLLYSPAFLPQVGGLEINVATLAAEFAAVGHEVVVITRTPGAGAADPSYRVVRRPTPREFLRWTRWSDVFFQANVSLRGLWPLLFLRRPWVVSHHSWYCRSDGRIAWQDRLKRYLLRHAAASIAVSRAVAADLDAEAVVIGNAYRDRLFRVLPGERSRDLIALGRLVSDKGLDLLLEALALLAAEGSRPRLTIAGDGPERPRLAAQAERLGLAAQVDFPGTVTGEDLVRLLNRHRVLVVPSRYNEPFGIVALEGIACGCAVVGSAGGGLAEAIGPCGRTYPNGDVPAMARALADLLRDPAAREEHLRHAAEHLAPHTSAAVAERYLEVLVQAARRAPREGAVPARSGAR